MKTRDYHAMRGRVPGAWDGTGLALAVAREIDRAVRKARREERAHVLDLVGRGISLACLVRKVEKGAGR